MCLVTVECIANILEGYGFDTKKKLTEWFINKPFSKPSGTLQLQKLYDEIYNTVLDPIKNIIITK